VSAGDVGAVGYCVAVGQTTSPADGRFRKESSMGIALKVPRAKVLVALKDRLAQIESDYKHQAKYEADFVKAHKKWQQDVIKLATTEGKILPTECSVYVRAYGATNQINLQYEVKKEDLPEEPTRDWESISDYRYREMHDEISNAIRVIEMCEDEVIPASTLKPYSHYL
jgi:hypothetical protein